MSAIETRRDLPDNSRPSPAPSTAGSTGTSSVTVKTGSNGQMSFRRWVRHSLRLVAVAGLASEKSHRSSRSEDQSP